MSISSLSHYLYKLLFVSCENKTHMALFALNGLPESILLHIEELTEGFVSG